VVYLVRDGRTVALSYLEHSRREGYRGEISEFLDRFLDGRLDGYGPWHEHVLSAFAFGQSTTARFLVVRYEELQADPEGELARTLAFLGCEVDRDVLIHVVAANTKARMRERESSSAFLATRPSDGTPFVRPARAAGWDVAVPPEDRRRFEAVCEGALEAAGYAT
jgi:hypothetical protein